jgi:hypothetical protein
MNVKMINDHSGKEIEAVIVKLNTDAIPPMVKHNEYGAYVPDTISTLNYIYLSKKDSKLHISKVATGMIIHNNDLSKYKDLVQDIGVPMSVVKENLEAVPMF